MSETRLDVLQLDNVPEGYDLRDEMIEHTATGAPIYGPDGVCVGTVTRARIARSQPPPMLVVEYRSNEPGHLMIEINNSCLVCGRWMPYVKAV